MSGSGDVFVADQYNGRVDVFTQAGSFERAFGKDVGGARGRYVHKAPARWPRTATPRGSSSRCRGSPCSGPVTYSWPTATTAWTSSASPGASCGRSARALNRSDSSDVCTAASGCRMGDGGGDAGEFIGVFRRRAEPLGGRFYVADHGIHRIDEYGPYVNSAPVAVDDAYPTTNGTRRSRSAPRRPALLANDTDADGDPLTAVGYTQPAHGTLTHNADGTFTYRPAAGFHGSDSFTYTAAEW